MRTCKSVCIQYFFLNQCHVIPDSCQVGVRATSISVLHYAENLWGCHYVNFSSVKVTVFQTTVTLVCRLFLPQSELYQYFEYFPHCSARQSSHGCLSNTRSLGKSWAPSWDTLSKGTKASDLTELQTRTVSTAFRYEQGNETLLPRPFFFQWLVNTVPKVETLSEGPTAPAPVNIHLGDVFRNERRNDAQTPQQRFPFYFSDKLALLPESWGRLGEGPQRITEF